MPTGSNTKRDRAGGSTPEMIVLSREDAESYAPTGREVCISISDPQAPPARISESFVAVLRLHFDDVVESTDPSDILFGAEHAREIDRFIERWPDAERIVVHCNMGMSRSPGVALGLCDLRGWATAALERSHPGWNRLVRKKLVETGRAESGGAS
ncbi:MAG TPA: hypothetical protein VFK26_04235 [Gemmatimonadaceae bacterium]|jgi:predicted protein tyrosine phosphatase|nr:hypothetical protein [Gemmatimonadaceae bacterium]